MKIKRRILSEWDSVGKDVTALGLYTFALVTFPFMGLTALTRALMGRATAGGAYLVLCVAFLALFLRVRHLARTGQGERARACVHPLVLGFIFGLSGVFFLDGGLTGGAPILFLLALAATPCFLAPREALSALALEIAAYVAAIAAALRYPDSIDVPPEGDVSFLLPLLLTTAALCALFTLYTHAYRSQQGKLERALSDANSASRAKTSFLNSMSHDIRTPMNSILGMNEMILREEDRPEITEYAMAIQRAGRALLGTINDILDYSKLQDDRMEIIPVRYDLTSLLNDMVNIAAEAVRKKSLKLDVQVDKNIPRMLMGDEYHLRQVMMNILSNAAKYTERGTITFRLGYEPIGSGAILLKCAVVDTGVGIKPEDMDQALRPFEHANAAHGFRSEGAGLGLAIVRQLLHLMGSELKVESVFRQGSTFSFEVRQDVMKWDPLGDYDRFYDMVTAHYTGYQESFQAPEARILVVDDSDVNLLVFINLLKKTRMQIDTALSGMDMLQLVRMNHYDAIFLDHRMPGMDGVEALHAMRRLPDDLNAQTPVIALTANAVIGARQTYLDEGFDDYLPKPVDTVRLEQLLVDILPPELVKRGGQMTNEPKAEAQPVPEAPAPKAPENPYARLPGIDYEAAITNCGSEETFEQALRIFYETLDQKAGDIEKFQREGDVRNYTILVHALKSAARLVGALQLSADAKYLEECGDREDVKEIEARTPALLSQYRGYKKILTPLFGAEEAADDRPEIPLADLQEFYGLIKGLAQDFDLDNIDKMMEEVQQFRIPEAEKERFAKVKECVTAADWGSLEKLL